MSVFEKFKRALEVEGFQIIFVIWLVVMGILWGLL